ncbi:MAG: hypothetical protein ACU841_17420 [Gammaproteobacteria bacterium]
MIRQDLIFLAVHLQTWTEPQSRRDLRNELKIFITVQLNQFLFDRYPCNQATDCASNGYPGMPAGRIDPVCRAEYRSFGREQPEGVRRECRTLPEGQEAPSGNPRQRRIKAAPGSPFLRILSFGDAKESMNAGFHRGCLANKGSVPFSFFSLRFYASVRDFEKNKPDLAPTANFPSHEVRSTGT